MRHHALLSDRCTVAITGADAKQFLQGLISNDIQKLSPHRALYSALLTPQGKFLFDFFIYEEQDRLLIDIARAWQADFIRKLNMYKLRSDVNIAPLTYAVYASWGESSLSPEGNFITACADPRLHALGVRMISAENDLSVNASEDAYHLHRLTLAVPDGIRDMAIEKDILLELGFESLHGVDFAKGCYMGQELTARTKYRGLIKKHLFMVQSAGGYLPAPSTAICYNGEAVGEMRSSSGAIGLAMIRNEAVNSSGGTLLAGELAITAHAPPYTQPNEFH